MKTIFNTIILALLAIFVAACGDDPNINMNPDSGVPDGSVDECLDETPTSTCGLNGNGLAVFECVDGAWEETGCDDSDVCMNDAVDSDVCGNEGLGMVIRTCVDGAWGDFGDCDFETHDDFYTDLGATFYNEGDSWNGSEVELGEEFTVSMWVNRTEVNGAMVSFTDNGNVFFRVGCIDATCTTSYSGNLGTFDSPVPGSYHHLIVTVSSVSGMTVYLDGIEVDSNDEPYNGEFSSATLNSGSAATVNHLSIFDGVLSADEVRDLYSYGH